LQALANTCAIDVDTMNATMGGEQLGRVIVDQRVLAAVVELTALTVPGIIRTAPSGHRGDRTARRTVSIEVDGNAVRADIGIIVAADANVATVSAAVRQRVAAAIERLLSMEAKAVNVFVRDVEGTLVSSPRDMGTQRESV
jgi:uncharacterized alkaline shock family protein YloU